MRYYILDDLVDPASGEPLTVVDATVVDRPAAAPIAKCRNWCGYRSASPERVSDADCQACQRQWITEGRLSSSRGSYRIVNGIPRLLIAAAAIDHRTQQSFGYEWQHFPTVLPEYRDEAQNYFHLVTPELLRGAVVLDAGCGMGRWARHVAELPVSRLYAIDFSSAIDVAAHVLEPSPAVHCVQADVTRLPFRPSTFDFAYCLGVLHHLERPDAGMRSIVGVLKRQSALLVYLYYALDNRPAFHRWLLSAVTAVRRLTVKLPSRLMHLLALGIGVLVYWPLARAAGVAEWAGLVRLADAIPLSHYRKYSWRFMAGDAFDRFATPVERRYTRVQIRDWLHHLGFDASFSERTPYWVALGRRQQPS